MKNKIPGFLLAIAVGCSVAAPVVCFPLGLHEKSAALTVRQAYASAFPEEEKEEEVLIEEWAVVSAEDTEGLIDVSNGATVSATYFEGYEQTAAVVDNYRDVPAFTIYQQYDSANLPIELLDPQFFTPDDTFLYIQSNNSILKDTPDMDSLTLKTLATGEGVTRIGIGDQWSKIRTSDGTEGYVLTSTLSYEMVWVAIERIVWVDTGTLLLRSEASVESEVLATLPDETRLHCIAIADKWYKVITPDGTEGYVYTSFTTQTPPPTPTPIPQRSSTGRSGGGSGSSGGGGGSYSGSTGNTASLPVITGCNGSSVVSAAESLLGVSYVYGGESSSGVDCSGLVVYAYRQVGVSVPHFANSIASSGVAVSRSDIQPGDVVCYDYGGGYCGHVGIYVGGGQVIHASNSREEVRYASIDMMSIMTIRRFIQ